MYEYQEMAKYYDLFYSKKSYNKEVEFLKNIIKNKQEILDIGCGTGIHMSLLEKEGYQVDGLDLSQSMLDIAQTRTKGHLYNANLLDYKLNHQYDAIISMFAVFNHLKNYSEFETGIINAYNHLRTKGILIIDLHNGRTSGTKENTYDNYTRTMTWTFNPTTFKEKTKIEYKINNKIYQDTHEFLIYEISKIKKILNKHNLKYNLYENYTLEKAKDTSKNIIIVISK